MIEYLVQVEMRLVVNLNENIQVTRFVFFGRGGRE